MARNEVRVNKAREDQAVNVLVEQLIASGGFNVIFPAPNQLFHGLLELILREIEDGEETPKSNEQSSQFDSETKKGIYAEQRTQCVWDYFHQYKADKFRLALTELIHEALRFSWPIHRERCGFGEDEINDARPTMADLQQNVLRRSLCRLRSLPVRKERETEFLENDPQADPILRAAYEIQNNFSLWTYDHVRLYELLREGIHAAYIENGHTAEDASDLSHLLANEMAELIWEHVGEAVGVMVKILINIMVTFALPSLARQYEISDSEIAGHKHSVGRLKEEIINPLIDTWLESFLPLLRSAGGSQPIVDVSDDDCKEYARRYKKLHSIIQEASRTYKEAFADAEGFGQNKELALAEVRRRHSSELGEDIILQIPERHPSQIALFAASKGLSMHGYRSRKLEAFRKRGLALLREEA